jgi:hypothetical protein
MLRSFYTLRNEFIINTYPTNLTENALDNASIYVTSYATYRT